MAKAAKSNTRTATKAKKAAASKKAPPSSKTAAKSRSGSRSGPKAPTVAVLGGGISGMTAALKLAKVGFDVTIFEMQERLGGNTSSRHVNGVEHDVYPHMFCSWYDNFWDLYEDELGREADDLFEPREGSKVLQKGETEFGELLNPTSIEAAVSNLKSGVMSPAEMWLLGYSGLDLAAHPFDRSGSKLMEMLSVNGFIYSRGYGTEDVAAMQNYLLTLIWSIPSSWTAAATYQNFLRHTFQFPNHAPFNYLLKDSLQTGLIGPFTEKLEEVGCKIRLKREVTAVRLDEQDRPEIYSRVPCDDHLRHDSKRDSDNENRVTKDNFDYAIMSLPVEPMTDMVMGASGGRNGTRIVDRLPELSRMQNLSSVSIPVVDLYLNRKLEDFPRDHVALAGSKFGLTVLDISQLWEDTHEFGGKTALVLAASEGAAIPSVEIERMGELMLEEFAEFFPGFNPGAHWGDTNSDVDWSKSWIRTNRQYKLFLNDTGSWSARPQTLYEDALPRVAFAGDCTRSDVDMATVEGAIQTGVQAAAAIQAQDAELNGHARRGEPIEVTPHTVYSTATFRFARLFYLPATYAAFSVAAFQQWAERMKNGDHHLDENEFTLAEYMLLVPSQFVIDWWKSAYWFARAAVGKDNKDPFGGRITYLPNPMGETPQDDDLAAEEAHIHSHDDDHIIGLPEAMAMVAREVFEYASGREKPDAPEATAKTGGAKPDPLAGAVDIASGVIETALNLGENLAQGFAKRRPETKGRYRRRWRTKR